MNDDQTKAIKKAFDVLNTAIFTINDCNDLWLSDVRDMEAALWTLQNQFKDICCKDENND